MLNKNIQILDRDVDKDNNIWRTEKVNQLWKSRVEHQFFQAAALEVQLMRDFKHVITIKKDQVR